jgi:integrase/recombinase XerC
MYLQEFIDYLSFQKRFSPHSIAAYRHDLDDFFHFVQEQGAENITDINHIIIRSWIVSLMEQGLEARSVNRKISTLKSYYKFLMREQKITVNPMFKIISPKTAKKLPVFVESNSMDLLFDQLNEAENYEDLRNKIILKMFYFTGMRLAELINIKKLDVDFTNCQVKVLGKRNKERIIPFTLGFKKEIEHFMTNSPADWAVSTYLFSNKKGTKLYPKLVYNMVNKKLGEVTTISKKSPHILRHTFATHMLNNGADLNAIKELLGHANLSATQVYTHNTIEKLKNVHKLAHPKA